MKNILRAFIYALLGQILCWGTFFLIDKYIASKGAIIALFFGIILLMILLILCFKYNKKIVEKHNLDFKKFNIYFAIFWLIFTLIVSYFAYQTIDISLVKECQECRSITKEGHGCSCYLSGIEYEFYSAFLIVVLLIEFIWSILEGKKIKLANNQKKKKVTKKK